MKNRKEDFKKAKVEKEKEIPHMMYYEEGCKLQCSKSQYAKTKIILIPKISQPEKSISIGLSRSFVGQSR